MSDTKKAKEVIASELAENCKYDAGCVDEVSNILSTYADNGYTVEDFEKFTAEQCSLISQALKQYSDDKQFMNLILNRELNLTQMQIVLSARVNGVDKFEWLDQLANKNLHYAKGNYISQGMVDGFNMFDMIDPYAYDSDQVYEIFAGIKSNVAYRRYCDPAIKSEKMGLIRHALQLGLNVTLGEASNALVIE